MQEQKEEQNYKKLLTPHDFDSIPLPEAGTVEYIALLRKILTLNDVEDKGGAAGIRVSAFGGICRYLSRYWSIRHSVFYYLQDVYNYQYAIANRERITNFEMRNETVKDLDLLIGPCSISRVGNFINLSIIPLLEKAGFTTSHWSKGIGYYGNYNCRFVLLHDDTHKYRIDCIPRSGARITVTDVDSLEISHMCSYNGLPTFDIRPAVGTRFITRESIRANIMARQFNPIGLKPSLELLKYLRDDFKTHKIKTSVAKWNSLCPMELAGASRAMRRICMMLQNGWTLAPGAELPPWFLERFKPFGFESKVGPTAAKCQSPNHAKLDEKALAEVASENYMFVTPGPCVSSIDVCSHVCMACFVNAYTDHVYKITSEPSEFSRYYFEPTLQVLEWSCPHCDGIWNF